MREDIIKVIRFLCYVILGMLLGHMRANYKAHTDIVNTLSRIETNLCVIAKGE